MLRSLARNRFRIVRELGEGMSGTVYEAFDRERDARVALKVLRQPTPDSIARFKREFRALQTIHHPNLVSLGELIFSEDEWLIVMDLVEGADFLSYVRTTDSAVVRTGAERPEGEREHSLAKTLVAKRASLGFRFDEARLRAAIKQLADGLRALHLAGIVHRDVKPANARVTPEGRVVLLDFGLVIETDVAATDHQHIIGTPIYMAPEQAANPGDVGASADLYAVGVLMFEAMTGAPPFDGTGLEILMAKQREPAPSVRSKVANAPEDLDELCARLLERDPARRPDAAELARTLGGGGAAPSPPRAPAGPTRFVGRSVELSQLDEVLATVRRGAAASLLIQGESGVGKSALVRQFVLVAAREPRVCVLGGRCYQREAVAYKAFDGVVDALVRFLMKLTDDQVQALLPVRVAPVVQVFPALRRVRAVARMPLAVSTADPFELRDRAFAGIRDLFARLSDRYLVVVTIDDVQWADADSAALFKEVTRQPDAPAVLFIGTARPTASSEGTLTGEFQAGTLDEDAFFGASTHVIRLGRLSRSDGVAVAQAVLVAMGYEDLGVADWIATEADGHPFFIDTLARYVAQAPGEVARPATMRLDEAIAARVQRLEAGERLALELLAISPAPVERLVLAAAAEVEPGQFDPVIASLRASLLVDVTDVRGTEAVAIYHDRIRHAVKTRIAREHRRALHERLALGLSSIGTGDAQTLATHWYGAGNMAQAALFARMAADHAARALAFERAANLYEWALQIPGLSPQEVVDLDERLGDALASAGRGQLAARAYTRAARGAAGPRVLDLQRRAADQLLRAGHVDEGLEGIRGVLATIGMRFPATRLATLVSYLFWLLIVRLRGTGFVRRDPSEIPARELTRIDACWSVAFGMTMVDTVPGATFLFRSQLLALRAGDPYRIARALAMHAGFSATHAGPGGWARTARMLERAKTIAVSTGELYAVAWVAAATGMAHYLSGRFQEAIEYLTVAEGEFRECVGAVWELDMVKLYSVNALAQMGELRELDDRVPRYLREATDRGNLYASVSFRIGLANLRWLVEDRPADALHEVDEAMKQWSKKGVHVEHFYELLARVNIALYDERPGDALELVNAKWSALGRALLFRVQSLRVHMRWMRARAALAMAPLVSKKEPLLRQAETDARALRREGMPWSAALASLIVAGCACVRGDRERAAALLRGATTQSEAAHMTLHASASRFALSALTNDQEMRASASSWLREQGAVAPERMIALVAPGFGVRSEGRGS